MSSELLRFLAHAAEVESEAMTRYEELADVLLVHNNPEVAAFFAQMAREAALHLEEVRELAGGRDRYPGLGIRLGARCAGIHELRGAPLQDEPA